MYLLTQIKSTLTLIRTTTGRVPIGLRFILLGLLQMGSFLLRNDNRFRKIAQNTEHKKITQHNIPSS